MTQPTPSVLAIHHGAVPVGNIARSMGFYGPLLRARLNRIVNGTVSALQHGYPQVVQFQLAGCDSFGLALQYDTIPAARDVRDGTTWGMLATPEEMDRLKAELTKRGRPIAEGLALPSSCPFESQIAFQDPDGNTWELCAARAGSPSSAGDHGLLLRYVSLEATDLGHAEAFYSGQLGLECEVRQPGLLGFSVGSGWRWLFVRQVAEMSPRNALIQGPHVAFEVTREVFDSSYQGLQRREQYWERETDRVPWEEPWQRVGYFYDPFYNRLALVTP